MRDDNADRLSVLLGRAADQLQINRAPTQRILATQRRVRRRHSIAWLSLATVAAVMVMAGAAAGIWMGDTSPGDRRVVPAGPLVGTATPQGVDTVLDGAWTISALADRDSTTSALPAHFESRASITFDNGRLTGFTGCNWFTASYEQSGDHGQDIIFKAGGMSEVACTDDEPPLLDRLTEVRHVSGAGKHRQLRSTNDQTILELTRR